MIPVGVNLDTVKSVHAIIQIRDGIKFKKKCDGIYYYKSVSQYWNTPNFRDAGIYYHYLIILNSRIFIFKTNDPANPEKFVSIKKLLAKELGVAKTDSIKRYLLLGYKQFR